MGDYTNLSIELDLIGHRRRVGLPDAADRPADDPRPDGDPRQRCRSASRAATSPARPARRCSRHAESLAELREECKKPKNRDKDVCKQLNDLPGGPAADAAAGCRPACPPACPAWAVRGYGRDRAWSAQGPTMRQLIAALRPRPREPPRPRDGGPMITRRTKIQLMVFVLITLLGVSYVGARYARLDRLVVDDSYTVVAHFPDSGGIFAGAEVTYRGVAGRPGRAGWSSPTRASTSTSTIDNDLRRDPGRQDRGGRQPLGRRRAVRRDPAAGRRRAVPRPRTPRSPRRTPGSRSRPRSCSATSPTRSSRSTRTRCGRRVTELGKAFGGTGEDLQTIIDTGNSFIEAANENFDITTALIRDSNTVLHGPDRLGERDPRPSPATSSLFSGTLAGADEDLRRSSTTARPRPTSCAPSSRTTRSSSAS